MRNWNSCEGNNNLVLPVLLYQLRTGWGYPSIVHSNSTFTAIYLT